MSGVTLQNTAEYVCTLWSKELKHILVNMNSLKENRIRLNVLGGVFFFFTDFQEKRHAIKSGTAREYVMKLMVSSHLNYRKQGSVEEG